MALPRFAMPRGPGGQFRSLTEYESQIPKIIGELRIGLAELTEEAGLLFQEEARSRARVRTGDMRRGIKWKPVGEFEGEVVGEMPYTIFNEYGTIYMSAQPMFGPAAIVTEAFLQERGEIIVKGIVEDQTPLPNLLSRSRGLPPVGGNISGQGPIWPENTLGGMPPIGPQLPPTQNVLLGESQSPTFPSGTKYGPI
jgi:hypothetical protein